MPEKTDYDVVTPHHYVPSTIHMGDCNICGHLQDYEMHIGTDKWQTHLRDAMARRGAQPHTPESRDLRDLMRQIEKVSKNHRAYSMVYSVIQNCCDHIAAIARTIELREKDNGKS